jgi:hypothetical protein
VSANTTVLDQLVWASMEDAVKIKMAAHHLILKEWTPGRLDSRHGRWTLREVVGLTQPKRGTIRAVSAAIKQELKRQYWIRVERERLRRHPGPEFGGDKETRIERLGDRYGFSTSPCIRFERSGGDLILLTQEKARSGRYERRLLLHVVHSPCKWCQKISASNWISRESWSLTRRRGTYFCPPWSRRWRRGTSTSQIEFHKLDPKGIVGLGFGYVEKVGADGVPYKVRSRRIETESSGHHPECKTRLKIADQ